MRAILALVSLLGVVADAGQHVAPPGRRASLGVERADLPLS